MMAEVICYFMCAHKKLHFKYAQFIDTELCEPAGVNYAATSA